MAAAVVRAHRAPAPPPPDPSPRPVLATGTVLALVGPQATTFDVDSGREAAYGVRGGEPDEPQPPVVALGRRAAIAVRRGPHAGHAVVLDDRGGTRDLGPAQDVVAAAAGGQLWLSSAGAVRKVTTDGAERLAPRPLPAGTRVRGDTDAGLLLVPTGPGRPLLWDPQTGRVRAPLPPSAHLLDVAGRQVLWSPGCRWPRCPLRLTDLVTGATRPLPLPPGLAYGSEVTLSRDGRRFAVPATRDRRAFFKSLLVGETAAPGRASLVLGTGRLVDNSRPVWSSTGWVFVQNALLPDQLFAYRAGRRFALPVQLPRSTVREYAAG